MNDEILRFLNDVAHDTRTPLNGLLSQIDLMLDSCKGSEMESDMRILRALSQKLKRYLETIFDHATHLQTSVTPACYPLRLSELLENILCEFYIVHPGCSIMLIIDPALPERIASDPLRLDLLIGNLLHCILSSSSSRTPTALYLSLKEKDSDGFTIQITLGTPAALHLQKIGIPAAPRSLAATMKTEALQIVSVLHGQIHPAQTVGTAHWDCYEIQVSAPRRPLDTSLEQELLLRLNLTNPSATRCCQWSRRNSDSHLVVISKEARPSSEDIPFHELLPQGDRPVGA